MIAQRTLLKSGGFAALCGGFRDFINHPGADAPPLLGKEGNVHLADFMRKNKKPCGVGHKARAYEPAEWIG